MSVTPPDPWKERSFRSMAADLTSLRVLAQAHGVGNPADRIAKLQATISGLADLFEQAVAGSRAKVSADQLWQIAEASELSDFMPALANCPAPVLAEKLPALFSGPLLQESERASANSNRARNIAFELNLVCRLLTNGHRVDHVPCVDVATRVSGYGFYIHCKRPLSERRFRPLVMEAYRQLKRDLPASLTPVLGVIALSVGRVLNPNGARFVGQKREGPDLIDHQLESLRLKYASLWRSILDPRIVGVVLHALVPAVYPNLWPAISPIQRALVVPLHHPNSPPSQILRKLIQALGRSGFFREGGVFRNDA